MFQATHHEQLEGVLVAARRRGLRPQAGPPVWQPPRHQQLLAKQAHSERLLDVVLCGKGKQTLQLSSTCAHNTVQAWLSKSVTVWRVQCRCGMHASQPSSQRRSGFSRTVLGVQVERQPVGGLHPAADHGALWHRDAWQNASSGCACSGGSACRPGARHAPAVLR